MPLDPSSPHWLAFISDRSFSEAGEVDEPRRRYALTQR
jgi:hypothetical protein